MKVALLSTNDITGGAAIVTLRLARALSDAGVDATMVAARRADPSCGAVSAGNSLRFKSASLAERLEIYLRNGRSRADLFKVDTAARGLPLHRHEAVRQADIVVVAWVNQGMLSLDGLARIAADKPVVVVMHDMWWLTGICHHAGDCDRYTAGCGHCPLLNTGAGASDLSARTWRRKKEVYANPNIHFVAVSSWLRDKCLASPLMAGKEIHVIPNPFPVEEFASGPYLTAGELGLPEFVDREDKREYIVVAMGAARLDDPIKCFPLAIKALNYLHTYWPYTRKHAIFFGALRDPSLLDALKMPYTWLGPVSDPRVIRSIYHHSTAVLSSSSYETLPTTLIEGQAAGCFPVSFNRGGQADIITQGETGVLVDYPFVPGLGQGLAFSRRIRWTNPTLDDDLRRSAARFAAPAIAARYLTLFRTLLPRS